MPKSAVLQVRVGMPRLVRLDAIAAQRGVKRSAIVRQALDRYLAEVYYTKRQALQASPPVAGDGSGVTPSSTSPSSPPRTSFDPTGTDDA